MWGGHYSKETVTITKRVTVAKRVTIAKRVIVAKRVTIAKSHCCEETVIILKSILLWSILEHDVHFMLYKIIIILLLNLEIYMHLYMLYMPYVLFLQRYMVYWIGPPWQCQDRSGCHSLWTAVPATTIPIPRSHSASKQWPLCTR